MNPFKGITEKQYEEAPADRRGSREVGHGEGFRAEPAEAGLMVIGCEKGERELPNSPPNMNEGRKDDADKDRMELIPPELLFAVSKVLTFGARKYADRNWEKGMRWGRVFGALMRHLWAWWGGKGPTTKSFLLGELDAETSFSHLWHAACCLTFLIAYEERSVGVDDRATDPSGHAATG